MKHSHSIVLGTSDGKEMRMDLDGLMKQRLLIQANSGGGKSWLLRRLAEQLFGKVPVIIIDPEGEFATLREKFGYVLVGKGGETPADSRSAELVSHKLLELRASAVCDLYELKPDARHHWVKLFLEGLINAPKNLWRPTVVIIDEAHVFCPEGKAGESEASGAVVDLATRGRKRRFSSVLATQRLGKLRKDATAELLNRLVGPTFEDVDLDRAADLLSVSSHDKRAFFEQMRVLPSGTFYGLGRALCLTRTLLKVGPVQTSHEIEDAKFGTDAPPLPDAIKALLPKLADLPKAAEEKAKTEGELRREITELKKQLKDAKSTVPQDKPVDVPVFTKAQENQLEELNEALSLHRGNGESLLKQCGQTLEMLSALRTAISKKPAARIVQPARASLSATVHYQAVRVSSPRPLVGDNGKLPIGERKILEALIQYNDGLPREALTVMTGYKRSSRDAYIQRLLQRGFAIVAGDVVRATEEGVAALPDAQPLPTGEELQQYHLGRLPIGERKILEVLIGAYPNPVERDQLTEATGYQRSSRDAYIQRLRSKQIITEPQRGFVRAVDQLFE